MISTVIVWPQHMDFPLFRQQLIKYKKEYGQILVALSNNHEPPDIGDWVKSTLSSMGIPVFPAPELRGEDDWRDRAIKQVWGNVNNPWVLFTEQDFFIKDESFWDKLWRFMETNLIDMICYKEDERLHPAFMLVRKKIADQTRRDFSPIVNVADHFYKFVTDVQKLGKVATLEDVGLSNREDFIHLKGLTHNFQRFRQGLSFTGIDEFLTYNHYALDVDPQHPLFLAIEEAIEDMYGEGTGKIAKFFTSLSKIHAV